MLLNRESNSKELAHRPAMKSSKLQPMMHQSKYQQRVLFEHFFL